MAKNGRRPSSRGIVPNNKKQDKKVTSAFDTKINIPPGQEAVFNVQDNTAYLKQREKRASQIMGETGASYDEAIRQYTEEKNAAEAGTPMAIAERAKAIADAKAQLEASQITPEQIQGMQGLANQVGNVAPVPTSAVPTGINQLASNLASATPDIVATGLTRGVTGAIGGAVVGGGVASVPTALAGAAVGVGSSIYSELQNEYIQDREVSYAGYTTALKGLNSAIDAAQNAKTVQERITAVEIFNQQLRSIDLEQQRLKSLEGVDFLSKAEKRLKQVEAFNAGTRQLAITEMRNAISTPIGQARTRGFTIPIPTDATTQNG